MVADDRLGRNVEKREEVCEGLRPPTESPHEFDLGKSLGRKHAGSEPAAGIPKTLTWVPA